MAAKVTKKGILAEIEAIESEFPDLPAGFLRSVAKQESLNHKDWRKVVAAELDSSAGAQGVFQFMPATAEQEGVDVTDIASSARGAGRYLTKLKKQTGTLTGALAAYNWGIGNYNKWVSGKADMPEETQKYIPSIMGMMQRDTIKTAGDKTQVAVAPQPAMPELPATELPPIQPSQQIDIGGAPGGSPTQIAQAAPSTQIPIPDAGASQPLATQPSVDPATGVGTTTDQIDAPVYAVDTPEGIQVAMPQSKKEESFIKALKPGESNLLNHMDTLASLSKGARLDKPLIGVRKPDAIDKILLDVVKGVAV